MERVWSFASDAFPLDPGEEAVVNLELGGRRLAEWLAGDLREAGVEVGPPEAEDWGWRLELVFEGRRFWVGSGAVTGEPERFLVFLKTRRGLRGLLAAAVWRASFERLARRIEALLRAHPKIRDLEEEPA